MTLKQPGLFIKNADANITPAISGSYPDIAAKALSEEIFFFHRHFFPFRRVDLNASASTSTRE
jgi:hypothetical protein